MNYLTGIALGMWLVVFPVAVLLLVRHDRSQERAWEDERPEWADDCPLDSEGYPFPEATEPAIYEALCFEFWEKEVQS